jgi:hypothetical protein
MMKGSPSTARLIGRDKRVLASGMLKLSVRHGLD